LAGSASTAGAAGLATWDEEEDYNSDECVELGVSLEKRAKCKLLSAVHVGRVNVSDEDFWWPQDEDYDIETVDPSLEGFAEFLVEIKEALVWHAEARRVSESATETLCHVYHSLSKADGSCASGMRNIGRDVVVELRGILDAYQAIYQLDEHQAALDMVVRQRRVRASSCEDRTTRFSQTRRTWGTELLAQAAELLSSVDAALAQCGASQLATFV
jgi:hypothetical protein